MIYKKYLAYRQKQSKQDRINRLVAVIEQAFSNNKPEDVYDMAALAEEADKLGLRYFYLGCEEKYRRRSFFKDLFDLFGIINK